MVVSGDLAAFRHRRASAPGIGAELRAHAGLPRSPKDGRHKTGFMLGRVGWVRETGETAEDGSPRLAIGIKEYADVRIPNVWTKSQNPVRYLDIAALDIDLDNLELKEIGEAGSAEPARFPGFSEAPLPGIAPGISFQEARMGLSQRYGVVPGSIDFVLRG